VDELNGVASYYAEEFNGRKTSNGEVYDMNLLTAAHRTLPFNTKVRVRNLENGRVVVVRINDRGPFKDNRIIDLSLAAAKEIGLLMSGTARVSLDVISVP
jgi:rare lipoprotein A